MQAAANEGIITGSGDGKFEPNKQSSRAEALAIILRAIELNPEIKDLLQIMK
ncbi:S-layer homology domain-containing protein [Paenibacillus sp. FA6]|uniref:S-layer homology domain-containing protein n=1 Tax=Paenibacillus sp. FA6 TaxID=3413029 RepID=UPI003F659503